MVLLAEALFIVLLSAMVSYNDRVRWRRHRLLGEELRRLRSILADLVPAHMAEAMAGGGCCGSARCVSSNLLSGYRGVGSPAAGPKAVCALPRQRCKAAVLQLDICGFTSLSQTMPAMEVARLVHRLFCSFDTAVKDLGLFKMDTIGDAYIVAGFLPPRDSWSDSEGCDAGAAAAASWDELGCQASDTCHRLLLLGRALISEMAACRRETGIDVHCRIGLAIGPIVVGALGRLQPRIHMLGQVWQIGS